MTRFLLSRALPGFHAAFPDVLIDLRDAGTSRDLVSLGADVLLAFGWVPPQDAIVRTVAYTRWLVVAAAAFWTRHGLPDRPEDLSRYPSAVFRTPYGEVLDRWMFSRAEERVEVHLDARLIGDDRGALDAPVLAGQMLASCASPHARPRRMKQEGRVSTASNCVRSIRVGNEVGLSLVLRAR